jgi:hypothetical protein
MTEEVNTLSITNSAQNNVSPQLSMALEADAWDELADLREAELRLGAEVSIPLEEVMARLEARFPG